MLTQYTKRGFIYAVIVVLSGFGELSKVKWPNIWLYDLVGTASARSRLDVNLLRSYRKDNSPNYAEATNSLTQYMI